MENEPKLQGRDPDPNPEDIAHVRKKAALFLVEDDTEGARLSSIDFAQDIDEKRRNVVKATCKLFPHLKWKKLSGNNYVDWPDRVVWYGLRQKTSEELSRLAAAAVICGPIEAQEGVLPSPWPATMVMWPKPSLVSLLRSWRSLYVWHWLTPQLFAPMGPSNTYLHVSVGWSSSSSGPYNEGTIVVLDGGFNPMKAAEEVVCYDQWNQTHWPPRAGFCLSMMRNFSYRVSMNIRETLHFPYS